MEVDVCVCIVSYIVKLNIDCKEMHTGQENVYGFLMSADSQLTLQCSLFSMQCVIYFVMPYIILDRGATA